MTAMADRHILFSAVDREILEGVENYKIKVSGPLNESLLEKKEAKVFVENNCFLILDYF